MIYILFGEMGVGKNYVGEKLAEHLGCNFFDGDDALSPFLKEKVSNHKPLTVKEVEYFVRYDLIPAIDHRNCLSNMVVSQALYRADHRKMISDYFGSEVKWVYIRPPSVFTHMRRLLSRRKGWKWVALWLMSKPFFDRPPKDTLTIRNTDNLEIKKVWK